MRGLRIGSLFSGSGMLDEAVRSVIGGTVAWHSDIEPASVRLLQHRYPGVPNLGDITAVGWEAVEPVDVLTGGFPCQDLSAAGKRLGLRPGTRSGLWEQMAYAVSVLRPSLVVIENVRGLLSAEAHSDLEPCPWCVGDGESVSAVRALGAVLGDLAGLGFDAEWCGVRASDVGAPHSRFRVFIVAYPRSEGLPVWAVKPAGDERATVERGCGDGFVTDATGTAWGGTEPDGVAPSRGPASELGERPGQGSWGPFQHAVERWERTLGRRAPVPVVPGRSGNPRLNPELPEWMMGWPEGWVTQVPGLSNSEKLRVIGNGVCPQQAAYALRLMGLG